MSLLAHDGTMTAKAYSIVWLVEHADGQRHPVLANYVHKHYMPVTAIKTLEPGTHRLVSPFFNLSPVDHVSYMAHTRSAPVDNPLFANTKVLTASMDAIIYADGTHFGKDLYDLQTRFIITRNAEHDEAVLLLRELDSLGPVQAGSALPASGTAEILDKHFNAGLAVGGGNPRAWKMDLYKRTLGQEAAILKGILLSQGHDALIRHVMSRTQYPRAAVNATGLPT